MDITFGHLNLDEIKPTELSAYEPTPEGVFPMKLNNVKLIKKATDAGQTYYVLNGFYIHASKDNKFSGVNYNVEALGVKTVTTKEGKQVDIDLSRNTARFLMNYGYTAEALKTANISITALEDQAVLEEASWKGVETDIKVNGESIVGKLKETVVDAFVKLSKKSKPYIAAISAV